MTTQCTCSALLEKCFAMRALQVKYFKERKTATPEQTKQNLIASKQLEAEVDKALAVHFGLRKEAPCAK